MIPIRLDDIDGGEKRPEELYLPSRFLNSSKDEGSNYQLGIVISLEHRYTDLPYNIWVKSDEKTAEEIIEGLEIDGIQKDVSTQERIRGGWVFLGSHNFSETVMQTHNIYLRSSSPIDGLYLVNFDSTPPKDLEEFDERVFKAPRESLGKSMLDPAKVRILSENAYELQFKVGKEGIKKDGGIIYGTPWGIFPVPYWEGLEQNQDYQMIRDGGPWGGPEPAGQFSVSIEECEFKLDLLPFWEYSFATREYLVQVSPAQQLREGDVITVEFGTDRNKIQLKQSFPYQYTKTKKLRWYTPTVPLRVLIDHNGNGVFAPLTDNNSHEFKVLPGEENHIEVTASAIDKGAKINCITPVDFARNPLKKTGHPKNFSVIKGESKSFAGEDYSAILPRQSQEGLEHKSFTNPVLTEKPGTNYDLFWGEIHGHCGVDDGLGSIQEYFKHARDYACLDFSAMTPHAEYVNDALWRKLVDKVNRFNSPEDFITLNAFEWTSPSGHKNVYTPKSNLPIFRYTDENGEEKNGLEKFWNQLDKQVDQEVCVVPHHTLNGHEWKRDHTKETLIEIYSMWGSSECSDNPLWDKTENGPSVRKLLGKGLKSGFTAGSDTHHASPGLSPDPETTKSRYGNLSYKNGIFAVLTKKLNRNSIFNALLKGRTFATTGQRTILLFKVNGAWMGSRVTYNKLDMSVFCAGTDIISRIEIIKDGKLVKLFEPNKYFFERKWNFGKATGNYIYVRAIQNNGEMAWASPIFIS